MSCAAAHRVIQLEQQARKLGIHTSLLFLGDCFFGSPTVIQPLNIPLILKRVRDFDVIHAGGSGPACVMGIMKPLMKSETLIVYDVHGDVMAETQLTMNTGRGLVGHFNALQIIATDSVAVKHADYFLAASNGVKQSLLARGIKDEAIEVIPNGVDLRLFDCKRTESNEPSSRLFTVTYAGSFLPWHGVHSLIDSAQRLKNGDIKFKIIGFRGRDSKLRETIRTKLGNKVDLMGWLPQDELIAHLKRSDVLIIPADAYSRRVRQAAFPTKFAEYLALGKPVIVTRVDEVSELVEAFDCGFVCQPTPESLADTIRQARDTPEAILSKKGMNGRRLAEVQLDVNLIGKRYVAFLKRIVENQK